MKKWYAQLAVGIAVSAVFLWIAARDVSIAEVWRVMRDAKPGWLIWVALFSVLSLHARAYRWKLLFAHLRPVATRSLFASQALGFAANTVLPLRAGEAVKAYSIGRKEELPFSTAFATVVLERVFDMLTVGAMLALAVMLVPIPESAGRQLTSAVRLAGAVAGLVTALILALMLFRGPLLGWLDRLVSRLPRRVGESLLATVHSFVDGLDALTDLRQLLMLLLASVYVWATLAAPFGLAAVAMGLDASYGIPLFRLAIVATTMVAVFVMIPAAPGFVGTYQAGCIVALGIFGVSKSEALAYSLLVHALTYIPPTLLGLFFLTSERVTLRQATCTQADARSAPQTNVDPSEGGPPESGWQ